MNTKGTPVDFETPMLTAKGRRIWVRIRSTAAKDGDRVVKLLSAHQDITARKEAEAALLASQAFATDVLESMSDQIAVLDERGVVLSVNGAWRRFAEENGGTNGGVGVDYFSVLPMGASGDQAQRAVAHGLRSVLSGEQPEFLHVYPCHSPTEQRWFQMRVTPLRGPRKGAVVAHKNVTADERLRMALEATSDAFWDWDVGRDVMFLSPRWFTMLGYPAEPGAHGIARVRDVIHPEDVSHVVAGWRAAMSSGAPYTAEARMRHADGTWNWVRSRGGVTEWDAHGAPTRFSGTNTDIHETKLAAEARTKLEAQLAQSQKMESIGLLAGGVAHDFNNMLGVITGYTELAMEAAPRGSQLRADLLEVHSAANKSAALTRQLLAFGRRMVLAPVVIQPNDAIAGALSMLQRLIGEDIELTWRPTAAPSPILIDPSQLDQLLTNLVVNARDAIAGVGHVVIATANRRIDEAYCATHPQATPGDYLAIIITDDGCGIAPGDLPHIFEPFFTTKAPGKGTGLGLANVYGTVKQNGGFIDVVSAPGKGTSFEIHVPRHVAAATPIEAARAKPDARGTETILVVEDEASLLRLITRELSSRGYRVLDANSPTEALEKAHAAARIDLLLTDVVMPEMNGRELEEKLKTLIPRLKSLFMSAYPHEVIASRGGLNAGVDFIQKPFTAADLVVKARGVLDRG